MTDQSGFTGRTSEPGGHYHDGSWYTNEECRHETKGEEMKDINLTDAERDLAEAANDLAASVDSAGKPGFWAEEHTPPDYEDEVLSSTLFTRPGSSAPESGFTLWRGDRAYRVVLTPLSS
jgi:hypothetical protein